MAGQGVDARGVGADVDEAAVALDDAVDDDDLGGGALDGGTEAGEGADGDRWSRQGAGVSVQACLSRQKALWTHKLHRHHQWCRR